jgi:hypothetical protein
MKKENVMPCLLPLRYCASLDKVARDVDAQRLRKGNA